MEALFLEKFYGFLVSFFLLMNVIRIISRIYLDPMWTTKFYHFFTRLIEKFSIMRNNAISSFPVFSEIYLEPFDTLKIDKIGRLIK